MPNYQDSQTARNLYKAFAGESMARNKYSFFAAVARREGYTEIAEAFELAAANEREHARIWYNEINGIGRTVANLKNAIAGEHEESHVMYVEFAEQARRDGFPTTAALFERIAEIEKRHEERFTALLAKLEAATKPASAAPAGERPAPIVSKRFMECRFCGHIESTIPGATCPVCHRENAF